MSSEWGIRQKNCKDENPSFGEKNGDEKICSFQKEKHGKSMRK
jgi:hypothetical protein